VVLCHVPDGFDPCGISAKQIQRETSVTYKTAWRIKQIRSLLSEDIQLEAPTEMDESYFGGRVHGQGSGQKLKKQNRHRWHSRAQGQSSGAYDSER
jgi:hypothetical protein